MNRPIPILMYHQVTPEPIPAFRKYSVTPKAFAAQMNWLALAGYVPITLDALLDYRMGRTPSLPAQPIVITFDDGFQDCVEYAVPILTGRGFTAVFYLVAGQMGQISRWLFAERWLVLPLMSWQTARQLVVDGFQIGSHTLSHPHLADLPTEACYDELRASRHLLEDQLGLPIRHLAYPFGSFNPRVRAIAEEVGYQSACSVNIGLSPVDDDALALHRIPVTGHDTLLDFISRLKTGTTLRQTLGRYVPIGRWRPSHGQLIQ